MAYRKRRGRAGRVRRSFRKITRRFKRRSSRGGMRTPRPGKIGYRL